MTLMRKNLQLLIQVFTKEILFLQKLLMIENKTSMDLKTIVNAKLNRSEEKKEKFFHNRNWVWEVLWKNRWTKRFGR